MSASLRKRLKCRSAVIDVMRHKRTSATSKLLSLMLISVGRAWAHKSRFDCSKMTLQEGLEGRVRTAPGMR
jgi:hypothetical protein